MADDLAIQKVLKEILLTEPQYQYYDQLYQACWRFWEKCEGKELTALSKEGFIFLNVKYGTIESVLRALRKVKKELNIKDLSRYEKAQEHRLNYLTP